MAEITSEHELSKAFSELDNTVKELGIEGVLFSETKRVAKINKILSDLLNIYDKACMADLIEIKSAIISNLLSNGMFVMVERGEEAVSLVVKQLEKKKTLSDKPTHSAALTDDILNEIKPQLRRILLCLKKDKKAAIDIGSEVISRLVKENPGPRISEDLLNNIIVQVQIPSETLLPPTKAISAFVKLFSAQPARLQSPMGAPKANR